MAADITLTVDGDISPLEARLKSLSKISFNPSSTGFGRINRDISDFDKTLEAANKRILAFGTSIAIFGSISAALRGLVRDTIDVQKTLVDLQSLLKTTPQGLQSFANAMFSIAGQTGSTFKEVAAGAEQLARQGLTAEETLKRLNAAMLLSRMSGESASESVSSLTAALNSFNKQATDSTQLVNKIAALSNNFAVSAGDIAEAFKNAGQAAQGAGVNLDQFLALFTSAQQTTQQGGTIISTALKGIFERQARGGLVDELKELNIQVSDAQNAVQVLQAIAAQFDKLNKPQQAKVADMLGGIRQTNQLRAILEDVNSQQGVYANALRTSSGATDEAVKRNEALNQSYSALANQLGQNLTRLFSGAGSQTLLKPLTEVTKELNSIIKYFADASQSGGTFVNILKGIENVLSGPALIVGAKILGTVFVQSLSLAEKAFQSFISTNSALKEQTQIQGHINNLLQGASSERIRELELATSLAEKETILLQIYAEQNATLAAGANLMSSLAGTSAGRIVGGRNPDFNANFASPMGGLSGAITREKDALIQRGYAPNFAAKSIFIGSDPRVGMAVGNRIDEPSGTISEGVNRALSMGLNPRSHGMPNFALNSSQEQKAFDLQAKYYYSLKQGGFGAFDVFSEMATETSKMRSPTNKRIFQKIVQGALEKFNIGNFQGYTGPQSNANMQSSGPLLLPGPVNTPYPPFRPSRETPFFPDPETRFTFGSSNIQQRNNGPLLLPGPIGAKIIKDGDYNQTDILSHIQDLPIGNISAPSRAQLEAMQVERNKPVKLGSVASSIIGGKSGGKRGAKELTEEQLRYREEQQLKNDIYSDIELEFSQRNLDIGRGFKKYNPLNPIFRNNLKKEQIESLKNSGLINEAADLDARRIAERSSGLQMAGIAASFALPLAAGFTSNKTLSSSLNGAGIGAGIGSFFGPIGAAIGGIGGGAIGGLTGFARGRNQSSDSLNNSLQELQGKFSDASKAAGGYLQIQGKLNDLLESGQYNLKDVKDLMGQLSDSIKGISDVGLQNSFLANFNNPDKLQEIVRQYNNQKQSELAGTSLGALAASFREQTTLGGLNQTAGNLGTNQNVSTLASTLLQSSQTTLFDQNGNVNQTKLKQFQNKIGQISNPNSQQNDFEDALKIIGLTQSATDSFLKQYNGHFESLLGVLNSLNDDINNQQSTNDTSKKVVALQQSIADFNLKLNNLISLSSGISKVNFGQSQGGLALDIIQGNISSSLADRLNVGTPQQRINSLLTNKLLEVQEKTNNDENEANVKGRESFRGILQNLPGLSQGFQTGLVGDFDVNKMFNKASSSQALTPDKQNELTNAYNNYLQDIFQIQKEKILSSSQAQMEAVSHAENATQYQKLLGGNPFSVTRNQAGGFSSLINSGRQSATAYSTFSNFTNPNNELTPQALRNLQNRATQSGAAAISAKEELITKFGVPENKAREFIGLTEDQESAIKNTGWNNLFSNTSKSPQAIGAALNSGISSIPARYKANDSQLISNLRVELSNSIRGTNENGLPKNSIEKQKAMLDFLTGFQSQTQGTTIQGTVGNLIQTLSIDNPQTNAQIVATANSAANGITSNANTQIGNAAETANSLATKAQREQYLKLYLAQQTIDFDNQDAALKNPLLAKESSLQQKIAALQGDNLSQIISPNSANKLSSENPILSRFGLGKNSIVPLLRNASLGGFTEAKTIDLIQSANFSQFGGYSTINTNGPNSNQQYNAIKKFLENNGLVSNKNQNYIDSLQSQYNQYKAKETSLSVPRVYDLTQQGLNKFIDSNNADANNKGNGDKTNSDKNNKINAEFNNDVKIQVFGLNSDMANKLDDGLKDAVMRILKLENTVFNARGTQIAIPPMNSTPATP